jgi:hypothetical protein
VFTEFIKSDLSEDQILPVLRQLLPVLLAILGDQDVRITALSVDLNLNITLEPHGVDSCQDDLGFPSMCVRPLHGEGDASAVDQGGD